MNSLICATSVLLGLLAGSVGADDNWPSFRGQGARGHVEGALPVTWDVADGTNVRWTIPIPGLGHSSPVIWGDKLFLSTAVRTEGKSELSSLYGSPGYGSGDSVVDEGKHAFRLYCIDKRTGDVLWSRDAKTGVPQFKRHPKSTHANPTPVCDEKRVIVSFASEGLFCFDHDGNLLWERDLGPLNSGAPGYPDKNGYQWGFASSPILHGDMVIVQCDVENDSFLAALNAEDGTDIWRTSRDEDSTWGSPTVHEGASRSQVIVNGYKHMGGYDLETGEEIWSLGGGGDVPVPTPIVHDGLIYITNAHGRLRPILAISTEAEGELELKAEDCEHMVWSELRKGIYMQTPIVAGGLLYCCSDGGVLGCYDARTGEEKYRKRLGSGKTGFSGSAIVADGKLYFSGESGQIHVVRQGPEFEVIATNDMGETCMSTPAASDGVLYVRTRGHLLALAED